MGTDQYIYPTTLLDNQMAKVAPEAKGLVELEMVLGHQGTTGHYKLCNGPDFPRTNFQRNFRCRNQ